MGDWNVIAKLMRVVSWIGLTIGLTTLLVIVAVIIFYSAFTNEPQTYLVQYVPLLVVGTTVLSIVELRLGRGPLDPGKRSRAWPLFVICCYIGAQVGLVKALTTASAQGLIPAANLSSITDVIRNQTNGYAFVAGLAVYGACELIRWLRR